MAARKQQPKMSSYLSTYNNAYLCRTPPRRPCQSIGRLPQEPFLSPFTRGALEITAAHATPPPSPATAAAATSTTDYFPSPPPRYIDRASPNCSLLVFNNAILEDRLICSRKRRRLVFSDEAADSFKVANG